MPRIKAWRIGDRVYFSAVILQGGNRYPIEGIGRVTARYPDLKAIDVMDFKGHTWRVNCG